MIRHALALVLVLLPLPALAQSTYVAGAIGADVARLSHAEGNVYQDGSSGGFDVLSGALRVGTSIGTNWGAELEFVRSGRSNGDAVIAYPLYAAATASPAAVAPGNAAAIFPVPIAYRPEIHQRQTSIDVAGWARRSAGSSLDLVFLAGVALTRARTDVTQSIVVSPRQAALQPFRSTYIEYATRPLVGMEARIAMTTRLRLVPGIRVQGLGEGWLARPSVALAWAF